MRVMGIDPGLATTGYGIIDLEGGEGSPREDSLKLVEAGVITTPAEAPLPQRLKMIHDEMHCLVGRFRPEELIVEELFFAKNTKTAISVAQARGVVLLAAADADLPVVGYTPLQVKLQLTGIGRATKQQIQGMVARLLSLQELPKPDDAADALALALCHLLRRSSPAFRFRFQGEEQEGVQLQRAHGRG